LTTQGLLYGCSPDGTYDGEESGSEDDGRSENPELTNSVFPVEEYGDGAPVHHFVYYLRKEGEEHTDWTKAVEEKKKHLRCYICRADDSLPNILRIPLQCTANDEDEYNYFKGTHSRSLRPHEACTQGIHVGCARWGGNNENKLQRVFYFPGNIQDDPIRDIFCTLHAEDVDKRCQQRREVEEEKQRADTRQKRLAAVAKLADKAAKTVSSFAEEDDDEGPRVSPPTKKLTKRFSVSSFAEDDDEEGPRVSPSTKKATKRLSVSSFSDDDDDDEEPIVSPSTKKVTKRLSDVSKASPLNRKPTKRLLPQDVSVLPSLARKAPAKKTRKKSKVASQKSPPPQQPAEAVVAQQPRKKKKRLHESLDKDNAVSVSQVARPTLKMHRTELASKKSVVTDATIASVFHDLDEKVGSIQDVAGRKTALKVRKKYWKRNLSELATEHFAELWKDAVKQLSESITRRQDTVVAKKPVASSKTAPNPNPEVPRRDSVGRINSSAPAVRRESKYPAAIDMVDLTADDDDEPESAASTVGASNLKSTGKNGKGSLNEKGEKEKQSKDDLSKAAQPNPETQGPSEEPDDARASLADSSDDETAQDVPNRWSHLAVGSKYNNQQFQFGNWDSLEMIL
jgi:hypothetical protein